VYLGLFFLLFFQNFFYIFSVVVVVFKIVGAVRVIQVVRFIMGITLVKVELLLSR
jgi:hypothetical protein